MIAVMLDLRPARVTAFVFVLALLVAYLFFLRMVFQDWRELKRLERELKKARAGLACVNRAKQAWAVPEPLRSRLIFDAITEHDRVCNCGQKLLLKYFPKLPTYWQKPAQDNRPN